MEEGRFNHNRVDCGLEAKIVSLLHKFDIKREVSVCDKLNGVNCRRLMKHHIEIFNSIKKIVETNKDLVTNEEICLVTKKYK